MRGAGSFLPWLKRRAWRRVCVYVEGQIMSEVPSSVHPSWFDRHSYSKFRAWHSEVTSSAAFKAEDEEKSRALLEDFYLRVWFDLLAAREALRLLALVGLTWMVGAWDAAWWSKPIAWCAGAVIVLLLTGRRKHISDKLMVIHRSSSYLIPYARRNLEELNVGSLKNRVIYWEVVGRKEGAEVRDVVTQLSEQWVGSVPELVFAAREITCKDWEQDPGGGK